MVLSWKHMVESLSSPGIIYAVLTSSIALGCGVGMSLIYNTVLMENHHWQAADIGLIDIGGVVDAENSVSFGVTDGMTLMVERFGYHTAFGILAGILGAIFLLGIPVYILNPKWRAYISERESKQSA
ncbi:hypothetical protein C8035_v003260 [Colletotrichum spinosum]|uniref:Uncharacterized protein n=1 Tax=Colletotrichum spinosum TaxID=1347390 RepID=A0A4R8Q094_9PEZI|nr:hypothetical protein C8035_v003260 [Colletotrichum spinosum]